MRILKGGIWIADEKFLDDIYMPGMMIFISASIKRPSEYSIVSILYTYMYMRVYTKVFAILRFSLSPSACVGDRISCSYPLFVRNGIRGTIPVGPRSR